MGTTKIEWATDSWNPVTGCTEVSPGCANCYAKRMSKRLRGRAGYPADDPFRVTTHEDRLGEPLTWRKPRRVFVCSMGDLFHGDVSSGFIRSVWQSMTNATQHQFFVLTKRPDRMLDWYTRQWERDPLPNVWLGVSVEDQKRADERIPLLLGTPAAVRFVSCEPLIGPVDLATHFARYRSHVSGLRYTTPAAAGDHDVLPGIDWVIVGGESGPGSRPMHPDWARSIRDQCQAAGVAYFFKQWGEYIPSDQSAAVSHMPYRGPLCTWEEPKHDPANEDAGLYSFRIGKKAAGRMLDRRTWDETPEVAD